MMPKHMMLVSQMIGGFTNIYAFWQAACESGGLTGLLAPKNVKSPPMPEGGLSTFFSFTS